MAKFPNEIALNPDSLAKIFFILKLVHKTPRRAPIALARASLIIRRLSIRKI
jgi:hypothetical protein